MTKGNLHLDEIEPCGYGARSVSHAVRHPAGDAIQPLAWIPLVKLGEHGLDS
jgi:hypothetical protein